MLVSSSLSAARFGEFAMRSTLTPDTAASASGHTMVMLGGLTNMDSYGAGGVLTDVGTVCLMSEPFDPSSETVNVHYSISLVLTDQPSGRSATFDLTPPGGLTAQVTIPQIGSATSHTITDLPPQETQLIGSTQYTVSALPSNYFTEPGPPTDKGAGPTGGFNVWITAAPVPEPATCAAALLGLAAAAIRRRR